MLRQSFIFLDKFGESSERKLWEAGVHTWDDFLSREELPGITNARKALYKMSVKRADEALKNNDHSFFAQRMPKAHTFRLYPHLKDEAAFVDIETTGYHGDITVVGVYDGENTMSFVRGFNLDKELMQKTFDQYKMLITFNGASFDLPCIRKYFQIDFPQVHIDLRHVCKRLGHTGGLKAIEKKLGIRRDEEIKDVTGLEAVHLWNAYKRSGNKTYLDKLVKYNAADIENLKPLADKCIKELWQQVRGI